MKTLTYIGYIFISLILSTTVLYIIGSFGSATTNLKLWSPESRGFIATGIFLGTVVLSIVLINYSIQYEAKKNRKEY